MLNWLTPVTNVLMQPIVLTAGLLLTLLAIVLTLTQHETLVSELPGLTRLLAPGNLVLMTAALVLIRGLHELGHAAVCRHLGVNVGNLGCN